MKKTLILILFCFITSIGLVPITSGFASENGELKVVAHLDLNRFQGIWYEIGHNPWFPEKGCFAMIAHYELSSDGKINVINICRNLVLMVNSVKLMEQPGRENPQIELNGTFNLFGRSRWIIG